MWRRWITLASRLGVKPISYFLVSVGGVFDIKDTINQSVQRLIFKQNSVKNVLSMCTLIWITGNHVPSIWIDWIRLEPQGIFKMSSAHNSWWKFKKVHLHASQLPTFSSLWLPIHAADFKVLFLQHITWSSSTIHTEPLSHLHALRSQQVGLLIIERTKTKNPKAIQPCLFIPQSLLGINSEFLLWSVNLKDKTYLFFLWVPTTFCFCYDYT